MRRFIFFLVLLAGASSVLGDPVISEFMASNKNGIADEDGDHPDWVEIHNPDGAAVNMVGWSLTDDASKPKKWIFPVVTIAPDGYLVVFASGKNRTVVGENLHTNFSLSAAGEYLALIKPDGVTKTTEFAPTFPPQFEDVSYGTSSSLQTVTLCQQGTAVAAFVPSDNSLGTTWQNVGFSDSGWLMGSLPVGFFNYGKTSNPDLSTTLGLNIKSQMGGRTTSSYIRIPFSITDPAKVRSMKLSINYDDGYAAFINGQVAASGNAPTVASLTYSSFALGVHNPTGFEDFDVSALVPQLTTGQNILAIQNLNESAASSDVYALPELTAVIDTGVTPVTGYFPDPTPGAENGGPESVQLEQTVAYSPTVRTFTAPFSLTLSGTIAGQEIRYNIADPSASPGAALADPTLSSTLYAGPIAISTSKLIRAAVFDSSTGQKGKTVTAQYLLLETGSTNNTSNFTSTLPIIVGDDHGAGQPVDSNAVPDRTTSMFYVYPPVSGSASLIPAPTIFTRAGLAVRGKSSQGFPKKSYALETRDESDNDLKMPLLGLAKESDWILNGPWAYDDTYIHNAFLYELSREVGHWASRTQFTEMFTNTNGGKLDYADYAGVYVLTEKIESGSNRLDITSIEPTDSSGDALTGGYIFKWDLPDPDEVAWKTTRGIPAEDTSNIIVEPSPSKDTSEQVDYIKGYIQAFEDTLFTDGAANFATRNYTKYIDVNSWVDFHIFNMLAFNVDANRLSTFFYKDRDDKIKAGPIWDYDRSLGSDNGHDANPRTWGSTGSGGLIHRYFLINWVGEMFKDPDFVQAWVDRWFDLRTRQISNANLGAVADAFGSQIGNTVGARDAVRWPGTGSSGNTPVSGSYLGEIARMKTWMTSTTASSLGRAPWIDSQLPGPPSASLDSGVVSSGTAVTLAGSGAIRYTTSGVDPRVSGGGVAAGVSTYSSTPVPITRTAVLVARRQGNYNTFPSNTDGTTFYSTPWSAPLKRVYLVNEAFAVASDLAVSEIHYHPTDPTATEAALFPSGVDASAFEFIELQNVGSRTVNTFEMSFTDGMPFKAITLSPLTLAPGECALVVKNRVAFLARYGSALNARIVGEWGDGSLSNDGERIQLLGRDGSTVADFSYTDGADIGKSLNRLGAGWASDVPSPGSNGPTYAQWKSFYFPNGGAGSGDLEDPDLDGAANELEYSQATDPLVSESQAAHQPTFGLSLGSSTDYVFTFTKPVIRPSAQYIVEQSMDLNSWTPVADTLVSTVLNIETRVVHTSNANGPAEFFRLKTVVGP